MKRAYLLLSLIVTGVIVFMPMFVLLLGKIFGVPR